ncbi:Ff.00g027880.m01.CDS01 [Fusarium sp. VM40]|nr:Ff.00g027880.m01.CDS01 [Fusarium sp. VM40]
MSDPLSVAGSAVGIISLGIQVCNGLLVYADAIRGRSQDLIDHLDQVHPLIALFKSLKVTIAKLETLNPEHAKILFDHLKQAEDKLRGLQELLNEIGVSPPVTTDIKRKIKESFQVAIYPIKKSKLEGARQTVQALLSSLTTAIQTVGLDLDISQNHVFRDIHSGITVISSGNDELKAATETNSSKLDNIDHHLVSTQQDLRGFSKQAKVQLETINIGTQEGLENTRAILGLLNDLTLQIKQTSVSYSTRTKESYDIV